MQRRRDMFCPRVDEYANYVQRRLVCFTKDVIDIEILHMIIPQDILYNYATLYGEDWQEYVWCQRRPVEASERLV